MVVDEIPGANSVAIGYFVGSGSRDEPEELAGASHLMEHMAFKGTDELDAKQVALILDSHGGESNAVTGKEFTAFYARVLPDAVGEVTPLMAGLIGEPALREEDLESERKVVEEEILAHFDDPGDLAGEVFCQALFPGHPLGRDVLGTQESVGAISSAELKGFVSTNYCKRNIVFSAAGAITMDEILAALGTSESLKPGAQRAARTAPEEDPERLAVLEHSSSQAQILVGYRAFPRRSQERWPLLIADQVLGGGQSSRLFSVVREQHGLAYSVYSDTLLFEDTGIWSASAGTSPEQGQKTYALMLEVLASLRGGGISDEEVERAKRSIITATRLGADDVSSRMGACAQAVLTGLPPLSVDEACAKVDAVTRMDVARVIDNIMEGPMVTTVVGPFETSQVEDWLD